MLLAVDPRVSVGFLVSLLIERIGNVEARLVSDVSSHVTRRSPFILFSKASTKAKAVSRGL